MTDAPSGKVPIGECVVVAWRFFFANWTRFAPAAAIVSVVSTLAAIVAGPGVAGQFMTFVVVALAGAAFTASVLRKAVRDEYHGPTGLAFGVDEAHIAGVLLCMVLILIPPVFVFGLVLSFVMAGRLVAAGVDPNATELDPEVLNKVMIDTLATPAGALSAAALLAIVVFVSARLIMANAATIGERKIVFLQTWSWTQGNVLRVIGAMLLTALPIMFLNVLIAAIIQSAGGPAGTMNVVAALVIGLILSFISTITSIPTIALGAHLYKGLRPPGFVAK